MLSTAPTVIDDPVMEGVHYAIPVAYIDEDGDMLALGHHTPRRALAAFNRHAREFAGLTNVADDRAATITDGFDALRQGWVVFTAPDPSRGEDPDWAWMARPAAQDAPSARPVTYLEP